MPVDIVENIWTIEAHVSRMSKQGMVTGESQTQSVVEMTSFKTRNRKKPIRKVATSKRNWEKGSF